MKIALTGASGFVGTALQERFPSCVVLKRDDDITTLLKKLDGVEVVVNLAGAPIIKRWSSTYKETLVSSRVDTTQRLVKAINASTVRHFISTSAIGIYPNDIPCDERSLERGNGFLTHLVQEWEAAALACDKKTTLLRFGIVLAKDGGALAQMQTPFKLGLGGIIGDGSMMMSWVHMDDLMGLYDFIITHQVEGVFNATAPHPISNYHFTKVLGKVLHRPTILPLPLFVLRLIYADGASVLSDSKEVYPKALLDAGFSFKYKTIEQALKAIYTN